LGFSAAFGQLKSTTPTPLVLKSVMQWAYHSKTINDDFTIYVQLPAGYDTSKISYPVLYMTDADWNMTVAMNCFSMLRQDYKIIQPIIIGIGYGNGPNKRTRDLNPADGGPKFLTFIEHEVMPFVQGKYRASEEKALYGYSFGGMFATMTLFTRPDLFNQVFIGAPGGDMMPFAEKYFSTQKQLNTKVFLGVGAYEQIVVERIAKFKAYLQEHGGSGLKISTATTPDAGHGAALAQVMQNAVKFGYVTGELPVQ
jgi:predicted alpha/beta superfamily hydrolase